MKMHEYGKWTKIVRRMKQPILYVFGWNPTMDDLKDAYFSEKLDYGQFVYGQIITREVS